MNAPLNHKALAVAALHDAQFAYADAQREASTASNVEIENDLGSLALMADAVWLCVARCWETYRVTNDEHDQREFTTPDVVAELAEIICERFGASREAAAVIAATIQVRAQ